MISISSLLVMMMTIISTIIILLRSNIVMNSCIENRDDEDELFALVVQSPHPIPSHMT